MSNCGSLRAAWEEFQTEVDLHDPISKKIFYSGSLFAISRVLLMMRDGATAPEINAQLDILFDEGLTALLR